ncbi:hypothetical protein AVEN_31779-1 [Araneus ventricosus]|uniref:Uncharacterized protein n=1 Tax=Araneus ventricosus TaxID=182803 RepID=A0A4Y2JRC1_ARAVE|nr:hypothetical protein AVEN_31779-1 [Araneus ventricosus]
MLPVGGIETRQCSETSGANPRAPALAPWMRKHAAMGTREAASATRLFPSTISWIPISSLAPPGIEARVGPPGHLTLSAEAARME